MIILEIECIRIIYNQFKITNLILYNKNLVFFLEYFILFFFFLI